MEKNPKYARLVPEEHFQLSRESYPLNILIPVTAFVRS